MKNIYALPANIRCPCNSEDLITLIPMQSQLSNWKPSLVILIKFPDLWKFITRSVKIHCSCTESVSNYLSTILGSHSTIVQEAQTPSFDAGMIHFSHWENPSTLFQILKIALKRSFILLEDTRAKQSTY